MTKSKIKENGKVSKVKIPTLDGFKRSSLILEPRDKSRGVIQFHNGDLQYMHSLIGTMRYISQASIMFVITPKDQAHLPLWSSAEQRSGAAPY